MQDLVTSRLETDVPQASVTSPVATFVRRTRYPVGATPVAAASHDTETFDVPVVVLAATDAGGPRVFVVAPPDPPPIELQDDQALPQTAVRARNNTPTCRARAPWLTAARRARVRAVAGAGISCSLSGTGSGPTSTSRGRQPRGDAGWHDGHARGCTG